MSPPRAESTNAVLLERIDKTIVGLQRRHEQLEASFEPFDSEDGEWEFNRTYDSEDVDERNAAELVHTNFERYHQLVQDVIGLGGKLAVGLEAIDKRGKDETWADHLLGEGVISSTDAQFLHDNTIIRNESQHAYVEAISNQVYRAAKNQLERGPKLVAKLAAWVEMLRGKTPPS